MNHVMATCDCGGTFRIRPKHGGLKTRCKTCKKVIALPSADIIEHNLGREVTLSELGRLQATNPSQPGLDPKDGHREKSPELTSAPGKVHSAEADTVPLQRLFDKLNASGINSLNDEETKRLQSYYKARAIGKALWTSLKVWGVLMVLLPLLKVTGVIDWSGWWVMSPWFAALGSVLALWALWRVKSGSELRGFGCVFDTCNMLLMVILPALRLFGTITWSWWWVMAPWIYVLGRAIVREVLKRPATASDATGE